MRPRHRLTVTAVAAVTSAVLVTGCSGDDAGGDPSPSGTSETASETSTGTGTGTESATSAPSTAEQSPTGVTLGGLVEGFPSDVIPLPPDATVSSSAMVPADGSRAVNISGTTAMPVESIIDFYRTTFVGQGFVETAGAQAEGFPSVTFSRAGGADLLVVTASSLGGLLEGRQAFTVGGNLAG